MASYPCGHVKCWWHRGTYYFQHLGLGSENARIIRPKSSNTIEDASLWLHQSYWRDNNTCQSKQRVVNSWSIISPNCSDFLESTAEHHSLESVHHHLIVHTCHTWLLNWPRLSNGVCFCSKLAENIHVSSFSLALSRTNKTNTGVFLK